MLVFFGLQYILKKWFVGEVLTQQMIDEADQILNKHFRGNNNVEVSLTDWHELNTFNTLLEERIILDELCKTDKRMYFSMDKSKHR